jgi:adenine-specific DNA-methyltransferase
VETEQQARVLPSSGPTRKALQEKGQFWTPAWVAEAMVAYVLAQGASRIFDPAVGAGAFFQAAKTWSRKNGCPVGLAGMEIDTLALKEASENGLDDADLSAVQIGDFVLAPPQTTFPAIVANPPYIRHHRLSAQTKVELKAFAKTLIGMTLDGRAGLHIFFLLRALQRLEKGGRLAFIVPADTCEGVFAETLWAWIVRSYRLEAVVTFAPEATPFPGVDTNAVILMLCNEPPSERFLWAKCLTVLRDGLREWVASGFQRQDDCLEVCERSIREGLQTGLSRCVQEEPHSGFTLGNFASVQRGIATGANEFFFMTARQAQERGIPPELLKRAVGRTRDVEGEEITEKRLQVLEAMGRPTYLLSLDKTEIRNLPVMVQEYLQTGAAMGLPSRSLITQRRPWYKMETREAPPFLFAYLGRRHARFIYNRAGILPLTGFLCVYPHRTDPASLEMLWQLLRHPETVQNLARVGKSYGSGAIKVEPRSLERLPIPAHLTDAEDLAPRREAVQLPLQFYEKKRNYPAVPGQGL